MKKLQALFEHLQTKTRLPRENWYCAAEECELILSSSDAGPGLLRLGWFKYNGVFMLERYPKSAPEFLAHLATWLIEKDTDRQQLNLKDPVLSVEINDDYTCDIEASVEFYEPLDLVQTPQGTIDKDGASWAVAAHVVDVAEKLAQIRNL